MKHKTTTPSLVTLAVTASIVTVTAVPATAHDSNLWALIVHR